MPGKLRLTPESLDVFRLAAQCAVAEGKAEITDDHLVLSIFRDEAGIGRAALVKMGVEAGTIDAQLGLDGIDTGVVLEEDSGVVYQASKDRIRKVVNDATHIALGKFGTNDIKPEHLLLALSPDESTNAAHLINWGYEPQTTTTEMPGIKATVTSYGQRPLEIAVIQELTLRYNHHSLS